MEGSRVKAVNTRDNTNKPAAVRGRIEQADASIKRYMEALDTADRQEGEDAEFAGDRLESLRQQVRQLRVMKAQVARLLHWGNRHRGGSLDRWGRPPPWRGMTAHLETATTYFGLEGGGASPWWFSKDLR